MEENTAPSHLDKLTDLRNFGCFVKDLEQMAARATEACADLSLAMVDIDHFLKVNELYGREVGDEVIRSVADHLREGLPEARVYRYAGDEFAVLMQETEKESAFLKLERLRESFGVERHVRNCTMTVELSVGISCCPEDGSRTAEIIRKAEGALFRAKAGGRSRVCLSREEKLVTKTSHYTYEQLQRLSTLAKKEGMGEAVLLREALDDLLKKYDD